MSEIGFMFFATLVWGIANAGAGITAGLRISAMRGPKSRRVFLGIVIFIALLIGNLVGGFLSFAFGYCENCSGRPIGTQNFLAGSIISLPSGLIWFILIFVSFNDEQDKVVQVSPENNRSSMNKVDVYIPAGPLGECPNCSSQLSVDSRTCLKCKAVFGEGAAWRIFPPK